MIAHLRGILAEKEPQQIIIDVGGVGYLVFIPLSTFEKLPACGEVVSVLTITYVREDAFHLYGFATPGEREMFTVLNTVNGIGTKLALAALSTLSPDALIKAVLLEDVMQLAQIPGVGKRIAMRLVVELKDRLPALHTPGTTSSASTPNAPAAASSSMLSDEAALKKDLTTALINLGYRPMDADRALRAISAHDLTDPSLALRAALKILAR